MRWFRHVHWEISIFLLMRCVAANWVPVFLLNSFGLEMSAEKPLNNATCGGRLPVYYQWVERLTKLKVRAR